MRTFILLFLLLSGVALRSQTYTVIADSLRLPTGLEVDAQGRLWVVESGYGFDDGAVSVQLPDGALAPVVVGLPSFFDTMTQESVGPWHTLALPNNQLAVTSGLAGGVYLFDLNGFTPGVSPPKSAVDSVAFLDITGFVFQNGFTESNPYSLARDASGNLYIADAAANTVVKVEPTGQMTVFDTFPDIPNPLPFGPPTIDPVPTRILAKPGGGFYVCGLTGFPFLDSAATIYSVSSDGVVTPYAGGFTTLTDMALDAVTGDLFVLQLGKFDLSIFNYAPNSAKVTRIKPNGDRIVVADGFDLGSALALDGQGNLYVSELGVGRILKWNSVATAIHEQHSGLKDILLAPNPTMGRTRLSFSLDAPGPVQLRVLNAGGRILYSQDLGVLNAGTYQTDLPAENLTSGFYWVEMQTKTGLNNQALLKY
ncbi:MAG: ScyD/ScyE family protein [Thermoanaerobaculia bacterium]|nr:ScyD/ScyE family protein [Thermoanaerobaculia bacterium]